LAKETALEAIVLQAIDAKSTNRFDSMRDFADALHAYLSGQQLPLALPGTRPAQAGKKPVPKQPTNKTPSKSASRDAALQRAVTISSRSRAKPHLLWWAALPIAVAAAIFIFARSSGGSAKPVEQVPQSEAKATEVSVPPGGVPPEAQTAAEQVITTVAGEPSSTGEKPEPDTAVAPEPEPAGEKATEADDTKSNSRRGRTPKRRKKRTSDSSTSDRGRGIEEW
jgi:hypothetical protein